MINTFIEDPQTSIIGLLVPAIGTLFYFYFERKNKTAQENKILQKYKGDDVLKTILKNCKIYVEKNNFQEAIFIDNGIIQQVGTNEEILKNNADNIIDLQEKNCFTRF